MSDIVIQCNVGLWRNGEPPFGKMLSFPRFDLSRGEFAKAVFAHTDLSRNSMHNRFTAPAQLMGTRIIFGDYCPLKHSRTSFFDVVVFADFDEHC